MEIIYLVIIFVVFFVFLFIPNSAKALFYVFLISAVISLGIFVYKLYTMQSIKRTLLDSFGLIDVLVLALAVFLVVDKLSKKKK
ncbi:hypothetical protein [Terribacillus sp. DMT04]|uniref:hypothetical protein n=1 Tax=Terribacillus sp. DMT04 TaxID=2850441 RepID=UPI001C2C105F|nr:hypothetical protein [Terribacillus sp. DMT04]QXE00624.1 hypothetical protein KS242_11405 [Terribacillus sp. DMT04]